MEVPVFGPHEWSERLARSNSFVCRNLRCRSWRFGATRDSVAVDRLRGGEDEELPA
jgi:hypothetical protein